MEFNAFENVNLIELSDTELQNLLNDFYNI